MAISATNLTFGIALSSTTGTTASISPAANALVVVAIGGFSGAPQGTPTVTGAGGTWTLIGQQFDSNSSRQIALFRDLSGTPGSGPLTITFPTTQSNMGWSVNQFTGVNQSGTHGSGAVAQLVQTATNATIAGVTLNLAALQSSQSVAFGWFRHSAKTAVTEGAGFTSLSNQSTTASVYCAEQEANVTAVNWTWPSQSTIGLAMALEIVAPSAAPTGYQIYVESLGGTHSSWQGDNFRQIIDSGTLVAAQGGAGLVRVSLGFATGTAGGILDACWIGEQASSGNAYNFDGNQRQLKFNGATSVSGLTGASTLVSDPIQFNYLGPGTRLVISLHVSGTTVNAQELAVSGSGYWFLAGASQAGATAPTGTWINQANFIDFVSVIEMLPPVIGWLNVSKELPRTKDYSIPLASTAQPILANPTAPTPTPFTTTDNSVTDDRPIRADIIGVALKATTDPIWPRAPPPAVAAQAKWIMDPSDIMPDRRW